MKKGISNERYKRYNDKDYKKRYLSRNMRGIMTKCNDVQHVTGS